MDSKIEEVLQNSAGLDTEESIGQLLKNKDSTITPPEILIQQVWQEAGECISKEPPGDPDSARSPDHPSRTISPKIRVFYSHFLNISMFREFPTF